MLRCTDCVHSFRSWKEITHWGSGYEWRCRKNFQPHKIELDPIKDRVIPAHYESCRLTRSKHNPICGEEGKLWTPKKSKHFFTYLKKV